MLSNTIEHCLNEKTKMHISLKQVKDSYSFSYRDGGSWDEANDKGMGTSLIPELVEHIGGVNYHLDSKQGLYYFEFHV
jgi:two-component sensor histidine kinase